MHTTTQRAWSTSETRRRIADYCVQTYLFVRISTLSFTLLLPMLGTTSGQHGLSSRMIIFLIPIGIAFHIFAYVLNDVVDLQIDRTELLRSASPLVQGKIAPRRALCLALSQAPLAFAIAIVAGVTPLALTMLGAAFLLLALYDLYGKRCSIPLLTDFVQAIGWCALLLFGTFAAESTLYRDTVCLSAYVLIYVLLINGIHGGVRDLANDLAHQACTTAIWLGARPARPSGVQLPVRLIAYAFLLQGTMVALAVIGLNSLNYIQHQYWLAAVPVFVALAVSTLTLMGLLFRLNDRRSMVAFGASHLFVSLAVLPAIYLPMLSPVALATVLAIFILPTIATYLYNGSHWCL